MLVSICHPTQETALKPGILHLCVILLSIGGCQHKNRSTLMFGTRHINWKDLLKPFKYFDST